MTLLLYRSGPYLLTGLWMLLSPVLCTSLCLLFDFTRENAVIWQSASTEILIAAVLWVLASFFGNLIDSLDHKESQRNSGAIAFGIFCLIMFVFIYNRQNALEFGREEFILATSLAFESHIVISLFSLWKYLRGDAIALNIYQQSAAPAKAESSFKAHFSGSRLRLLKQLWDALVFRCLPKHPLWRGLLMREHFRCGGKAGLAWMALLLCGCFGHPVLALILTLLYLPFVALDNTSMQHLEVDLALPMKLRQQYVGVLLYHSIPLLALALVSCLVQGEWLYIVFLPFLSVFLIPLQRLGFVERHPWISGSCAVIILIGFVSFFIDLGSDTIDDRGAKQIMLWLFLWSVISASIGLWRAAKADLDIREEDS